MVKTYAHTSGLYCIGPDELTTPNVEVKSFNPAHFYTNKFYQFEHDRPIVDIDKFCTTTRRRSDKLRPIGKADIDAISGAFQSAIHAAHRRVIPSFSLSAKDAFRKASLNLLSERLGVDASYS